MRAVLDANVIVSAFLVSSGPSARILDRVRRGQLTWVISGYILDEVTKILSLPRIQRKYKVDPDSVSVLVALLGERAVRIPGVERVEGQSRDAKDNPILACAVEGQATYLVTGDGDLLDLKSFAGIPILPPAAFERSLKGSGD